MSDNNNNNSNSNKSTRRGFFAGAIATAAAMAVPSVSAAASEPARAPRAGNDAAAVAANGRRSTSDGNIKLCLIVGGITALLQQVRAWLDDHGGDEYGGEVCECTFCCHGDDDDAGYVIEHDLRGLAWALEMGRGCVSSLTFRLNDDELQSLNLTRGRFGEREECGAELYPAAVG